MSKQNTFGIHTHLMHDKLPRIEAYPDSGCYPEHMRRPFWRAVLLSGCLLCAAPQAWAAIPVGTYGDATWTHDPYDDPTDPTEDIPGRYSVPASAYRFTEELYELPVQATGWAFSTDFSKIYSGSPGTADGKYWSYADLKEAVFSNDGTYWTIKITVAGDEEIIGATNVHTTQKLKGKYGIYFGKFNEGDHWAFGVDSGTGLDATGDTWVTDKINLRAESTDQTKRPPYGTAITTSGESLFDGYSDPVQAGGSLSVRTLYNNGAGEYAIEMRYEHSGTGAGPILPALLEDLDYLYVGVAVSNPSSLDDLFANDHFDETGVNSAEYDTLRVFGPTFASVSNFQAYTGLEGVVEVEWTTSMEVGSLGFYVERWDEAAASYVRLTKELLPSLQVLGAPQGGVYRLKDENALSGETHRYRLIEEESWGGERVHGPFEVTVD